MLPHLHNLSTCKQFRIPTGENGESRNPQLSVLNSFTCHLSLVTCHTIKRQASSRQQTLKDRLTRRRLGLWFRQRLFSTRRQAVRADFLNQGRAVNFTLS